MMLRISGLTYATDGLRLDNVEFGVNEGDLYVIFGPDDSGKTEILNAVMGLESKYKGEILYKERDIRRLSATDRRSIRFVPDDILLAQGVKVKAYLNNILNLYGIKDRTVMEELIAYFGIDINERLTDMTYEGNKLVAIIGALMTKPELLILDEPFNFVTQGMEGKILRKLKEFNEAGMTIVVAAEHFEDMGDCANRYTYINAGEVIGHGERDIEQPSIKAIRIKAVDASAVKEIFGEPDAVEEDECIYMRRLAWDVIGKMITRCNVDRGVIVEDARLEDVLDVMVNLENEQNRHKEMSKDKA